MNFNTSLDQHALHQGKSLYHELPGLGSGEWIDHLYAHWAVSYYDAEFPDYNVCVSLRKNWVGQEYWAARITQDPRHNAVDVGGAEYAAHTWHRNSHALGISVSAMFGATASDFGQYPIQQHQVEVMLAAVAACAKRYNVDVSDPGLFMTHAEAAIFDSYFGDRWDFERLEASGDPLSESGAHAVGDMFRHRAHEYKLAL